jgi:hypothetical protein
MRDVQKAGMQGWSCIDVRHAVRIDGLRPREAARQLGIHPRKLRAFRNHEPRGNVAANRMMRVPLRISRKDSIARHDDRAPYHYPSSAAAGQRARPRCRWVHCFGPSSLLGSRRDPFAATYHLRKTLGFARTCRIRTGVTASPAPSQQCRRFGDDLEVAPQHG